MSSASSSIRFMNIAGRKVQYTIPNKYRGSTSQASPSNETRSGVLAQATRKFLSLFSRPQTK